MKATMPRGLPPPLKADCCARYPAPRELSLSGRARSGQVPLLVRLGGMLWSAGGAQRRPWIGLDPHALAGAPQAPWNAGLTR